MVGMGEVTAFASSIKTAVDIAKGLNSLTKDVDVKAAISEIQGALMDAQSKAIGALGHHAALLEKVNDLEAELVRVKAWDTERQRYELAERSPKSPGVLAYRIKDSKRAGEPDHWICPACYQQGSKTILQQQMAPQRKRALMCPNGHPEILFIE